MGFGLLEGVRLVSGRKTNYNVDRLCSVYVWLLGSSSFLTRISVQLAACRRLAIFSLSQHSIRLLAFWNAAIAVY
jgi:hypothetical protein